MVLGAANTLAATQAVAGEAAEDEDQDMVYEDDHSIPLVVDYLHLDKDLLER